MAGLLLHGADVASRVEEMGAAEAMLQDPDTNGKQTLYQQFGLRLTYHPDDRTVLVEGDPGRHVRNRVSEGGASREPPTLFGQPRAR